MFESKSQTLELERHNHSDADRALKNKYYDHYIEFNKDYC